MTWNKLYTSGNAYKTSETDEVKAYYNELGYKIVVQRDKSKVLGYSLYDPRNKFIQSYKYLDSAKAEVQTLCTPQPKAKLYDKTYMQTLVNKARSAYRQGNLKEAGTYWGKIYEACPEPMTKQDYQVHNMYMRQFTNTEVYAITDYLKERYKK